MGDKKRPRKSDQDIKAHGHKITRLVVTRQHLGARILPRLF